MEKSIKLAEKAMKIMKKDPQESLVLLRRAIFLQPENPVFYYVRGNAYVKVGDFQSGILNYRKSLILKPQNVDIINEHLGVALGYEGLKRLQRGEYFFAKTYLEESLELCPKNDVTKMHHATCLLYMNERSQEQGVEILRDLRHLTPYVNFVLAEYLLHYKKDLENCKIEMDIINLNHGWMPEYKDLYKEFLVETGKLREHLDSLLEKKKLTPAVEILDQLIRYFPNDYDLYFKRAIALKERKEFPSSLKDFLKCRAITGGRDEEAERQMGLCLYRLGKKTFEDRMYANAVTYFCESLKWDTRVMDVYVMRGDAYLKLGNFKSAAVDYNHALKHDPDSKRAKARVVKLNCIWGEESRKNGNLTEAERAFSEAIKLDKMSPNAYMLRAKVRFSMKRSADALEDLIGYYLLEDSNEQVNKLVMQFMPQIIRDPKIQHHFSKKLGIPFLVKKVPIRSLLGGSPNIEMFQGKLPPVRNRRAKSVGNRLFRDNTTKLKQLAKRKKDIRKRVWRGIESSRRTYRSKSSTSGGGLIDVNRVMGIVKVSSSKTGKHWDTSLRPKRQRTRTSFSAMSSRKRSFGLRTL